MTELIDHPGLAPDTPGYPNCSQAKSYLVDFLRRGKRSFYRTKHYACYQYDPALRVLVIRLVTGIFEVRAYPKASDTEFSFEEALKAAEFRAWLFAYDYRTGQINLITDSQGESTEIYKLIRLGIKTRGKLSYASQSYLSIPTKD
ncbi:unnamed protein product [marine sediment metagenome]|uniref:Uncharacterized protein n=1 Tax=marine sediment metagenome TaxID=412755 RepID=X1QZG0_9ZZZZ